MAIERLGESNIARLLAKIKTVLDGKAASSHTHVKANITDFPSSMPASDVSAWAKAASKPTYTASEVGALPSSTVIPTVTNDLTDTLKSHYDTAYTHSQAAHAPSNAQKNSDITKTEIETKLTGDVTTHTHTQVNGHTVQTDVPAGAVFTDTVVDISGKADLVSGKVKAEQASAAIVTVTASKTLALTDAGKFQKCDNASAITVTVPANASAAFPVGTEMEFVQFGAGTVTFSAASGVTLNSADSAMSISGRYSSCGIKKLDTDVWLLTGSLA